MQVRLGFAVAAHLEPDILFIDEVLSVGDIAFQEKCLGKMSEVAGEGRTVVFVSHNLGAITALCPKALWLDRGGLRESGPTDKIIPQYTRSVGRELDGGLLEIDEDLRREAQVRRVRILSPTGQVAPVGECAIPSRSS